MLRNKAPQIDCALGGKLLYQTRVDGAHLDFFRKIRVVEGKLLNKTYWYSRLGVWPITLPCIGGSIFQHKRIHKNTWVSPDHVTENQIDFVCCSRKFRRSVLDSRLKRGADAASDHHLLTLKLKKNENMKQVIRVKYRVHLFKEHIKANFS